MRLEDQVSSLVLSKQLKDLGISQKSIWVYVDTPRGFMLILNRGDSDIFKASREQISVFTPAELLERLPYEIKNFEIKHSALFYISKFGKEFSVKYAEINGRFILSFEDKNLSNALAKMLCYLIENNLIN